MKDLEIKRVHFDNYPSDIVMFDIIRKIQVGFT